MIGDYDPQRDNGNSYACSCSRCSQSPVTFGPIPTPAVKTAEDALLQLELSKYSRYGEADEWRQNVIETMRLILEVAKDRT